MMGTVDDQGRDYCWWLGTHWILASLVGVGGGGAGRWRRPVLVELRVNSWRRLWLLVRVAGIPGVI